jgi:Putative lactococcus lactis phage r1t holin
VNKRFLLDLSERMGKSFVQGFVAAVINLGGGVFVFENLKFGVSMAVLSVLTSLASSQIGDKGSASAIPLPTERVGKVAGTVTDLSGQVVGEVTGQVRQSIDTAQEILKELGDDSGT